jgi:AcrR family transcriptional regulator
MARGEARDKLLAAGAQLFAERGYPGTTTREIAELAGVDAALIARYFNSKAGLYLACLQVELSDGEPPDLLQPSRMAALLSRVSDRGPSPVFQSAVFPHDDEQVQAGAREALHARLVTPLAKRLDGPDAQLRAELITAAFAGVALGRISGSFPELEKVPAEDLIELLQELFRP